METIECKAIHEDGYPAGLRLACELWIAIEKDKRPELQVSGISSFWDGVKLEGSFQKHQFEIGINYSTQDIVLLDIQFKPKFLEKSDNLRQLSAKLKARLEEFISAMPERRIETSL